MQSKHLQMLTVSALIIEYLCALTMVTIWKNSYACYVIAMFVSLLTGVVLRELEKIFAIIFITYIIASIISIFTTILPLLIYGSPRVQIDVGILVTSHDVILTSLIVLPICLFMGILGRYLSEKILE
ncbi:MAG: hypothetical protein ACTSUF_09235 [Candidatus Heimdallarchaeaceae archaeon]